jgi:biopolymer transport protein ExbD
MPIKTLQDEQPNLNLTPMIDVVFLLIVFFMVATKFTEVERDIPLQLPEVSEASEAAAAPTQHEVVVRADGQTLLDGEALALPELTSRLVPHAAQNAHLTVVIRGDAAAPYQHVAAALAACQQAGVTDLSVSVQLAAQPTHRQ